ncbi:MAG: site-specific integrase, partial [Candidatus Solibacter usitatus]|nr:site-specific integrase [Candidatus Solibacter usitatus]
MSASREAFLEFCRIEKGLSANSLDAYQRDLRRLEAFASGHGQGSIPGLDVLLAYIDTLYKAGLGSRSISRHLSTIRSLYAFLQREGRIEDDPTALLPSPRLPRKIPRYLNLAQVDALA